MRHASLVFALFALVPFAADAKPKPKRKGAGKGSAKVEAKKHLDKGAKAHKAGKYDVALTELQAAYELDPQTKLLFAIAQVQVKLDNCPDAIANYEKFLASTKDKQKQAVVKQAIEACNQKLAAAPPPAPPPPPEPPPTSATIATTPPGPAAEPPVAPSSLPPPEPMPAPVADTPLPPSPPVTMQTSTGGAGKPWYKDVLGDALVLSGVAAGAVSIVMYTGARGALDDAEAASTLPEYDRLVDDAHDKRTYAVILAGGGAVLIGAGILRYKLRDKGEARGVAIAPTAGGGLITWTGGF